VPSYAYLAPTYFSSHYFGPLGAIAPGGTASSTIAYRDRDAFAAIVHALTATGEFAEVDFPSPLDATPIGADRSPLAVVVPTEWTEQTDASSGASIRRVSYSLTLVVRREDARGRFETLDRLTSIVREVLNNSTLGGGCVPAYTRLRRGVYDTTSRHPELRLVLDGGFCYAIPPAVAGVVLG
jgi:hypothetical protein